jgi:ethanolamine ammonia-lyase small subunit
MTSDLEQSFWGALRGLTAARIGLPRTGASLATEPLLDFKLAHARARDAVHETLDQERLLAELAPLGLPATAIASAAEDRRHFLLRPDLGRRLRHDAEGQLATLRGSYDVAFVIADGLSAAAVQKHAQPLLAEVLSPLREEGWCIAPIIVVRHGRVAVGDVIAKLIDANCVAVLIGERPGLSAADSMGVYLTWQPGPQTTDANRNCISNIRPDGLDYAKASFKLVYLLRTMRAQCISGVQLKDDSEPFQVSASRTHGIHDSRAGRANRR